MSEDNIQGLTPEANDRSLPTTSTEDGIYIRAIGLLIPKNPAHSSLLHAFWSACENAFDGELNKLLGDYLTLIDTLDLSEKQLKALKDVAKERFHSRILKAADIIDETFEVLEKELVQSATGNNSISCLKRKDFVEDERLEILK